MKKEAPPSYGRSNACEYTTHKRNLTVGNGVYLPDHQWDTVTRRAVPQVQPQATRPYAQAASIGLHQAISQEASSRGLRGCRLDRNKAFIFGMVLFFLLGIFTLMNRANLLEVGDDLEIAQRGVDQLQQANTELRQQIDTAIQETDIGYRAANELGMIRASDAQTITLVAVDAYPNQAPQGSYTAQLSGDGWEQAYTAQLAANNE